MKQVSFESRGKRAVLGRMAPTGAIARQINAEDAIRLWWDAASANVNFPPDAAPDTGLLATTRIRTPNGLINLNDLSAGDLVLDHTGAETRVTSVAVAGKSRSALRFRAPYFGLDQDLVVGANQCLWMQSDRAEQMFGVEEVLMPAWALKDQKRVHFVELTPSDKLIEVKLESGGAVMVGGCALASKQIAGETAQARDLTESEARGFSSYYRAGFFTS